MTTLIKIINKLVKNYESLRTEDLKSSNPEIRQLFDKLEKTVANTIDPALVEELDIGMGLGSGRLPNKPILYLLCKSANTQASSGVYVALIIDTKPDEENYGNYRLMLTQGHKKQIDEYIKNEGVPESVAKKLVFENAKRLAVMLADSYYAELKSRHFNVASTDNVSSDLVIAERIYNVHDNTDDSQLITDINNLLRVYLNLAREIPYTPGSDGSSITDAYSECLVQVRKGQADFRKKLFDKYGTSCMLTGCKVPAVIEAAHIVPFSYTQDHDENNGLLLRADLHKLYDSNLLGIAPDGEVFIMPAVSGAGYSGLSDKKLTCVINAKMREYLSARFKAFSHKNDIE
jgi:hypothetical protein